MQAAPALQRASGLRLGTYVGLGLAAGALYVVADLALDQRMTAGELPVLVAVLHRLVDRVLPLATGALLGVGAHYLQRRAAMARAEAGRADDLRARLTRVERDQAVWVVAAATLHEVKNPLHTLGLLVDELTALRPEEEPMRHALLARLAEHVRRIRENVDALRGLSDRARPDVQPVRVDALARELAGELAETARASLVALRVTADGPAEAIADPVHVRIVLENLVGNAMEALGASDRGGRIDIDVGRRDESIVVRVRDDGPGIAADVREDLFEPLATTKSRGLGLGLPIARALARAMGGDLTVDAPRGVGTTFELQLPRSEP